MHRSACCLTKDVYGCLGAMLELVCMEKKGRSQNRQPYSILACGDVQCFRKKLRDKKRSAKGLSRTVQLKSLASREVEGVLRRIAKGFSRTVQLNPLASRETSSAQRQSMYYSAFSRSFNPGRLRAVWKPLGQLQPRRGLFLTCFLAFYVASFCLISLNSSKVQ